MSRLGMVKGHKSKQKRLNWEGKRRMKCRVVAGQCWKLLLSYILFHITVQDLYTMLLYKPFLVWSLTNFRVLMGTFILPFISVRTDMLMVDSSKTPNFRRRQRNWISKQLIFFLQIRCWFLKIHSSVPVRAKKKDNVATFEKNLLNSLYLLSISQWCCKRMV